MWKQWLNVLFGILIIVVAYAGASATLLAILGLLVVIFALWAALGKK